jgi:hypothetical protein
LKTLLISGTMAVGGTHRLELDLCGVDALANGSPLGEQRLLGCLVLVSALVSALDLRGMRRIVGLHEADRGASSGWCPRRRVSAPRRSFAKVRWELGRPRRWWFDHPFDEPRAIRAEGLGDLAADLGWGRCRAKWSWVAAGRNDE